MISFAQREPETEVETIEMPGPPTHADQVVAGGGAVLPLWLTEQEAELVTLLCTASPADGGRGEDELFAKLGEVLRAFRR